MATALLKAPVNEKAGLAALIAELKQARHQLDHLLRRAEAALPKTRRDAARPGSPGGVTEVRTIIGHLRAGNGNLSAVRIARLYGVSVNVLAGWLGRSRQAVSKTPDADSLQEPLARFEQVARLTTVISMDEFRQWLRAPNPSLEGRPPLALLISGDREVLAGLVDEMLAEFSA